MGLFLRRSMAYQYTKEVVPLTQELNDIFLEQSQVIVDFAVKLFAASQTRAIESRWKKLLLVL